MYVNKQRRRAGVQENTQKRKCRERCNILLNVNVTQKPISMRKQGVRTKKKKTTGTESEETKKIKCRCCAAVEILLYLSFRFDLFIFIFFGVAHGHPSRTSLQFSLVL